MMMRMRHGIVLATALLASSVLAGCGSSSNSGLSASASASGSVSTSPTASSSGVPLTPGGTKLSLGAPATVSWSPKQKVTGTVRITVTQLQSTTYKQTFSGWKLDPQTTSRAPYFVRAKVTNLSNRNLGGYAVPLYGLDSADDLVEASTFASTFAPCQPGVLPKRFAKGATASVCLVVLVPNKGKLLGVSYRPSDQAEPITWSGSVKPYTAATPKKPGKAGKKHKTG